MPYVERRVPVIADERVEREFGTGALKVTPGHDPTDYEIGRDHGLPELTVIGPDGRMNEDAGELAGLTQEEADERILAWLQGARTAREARVVPAHGRALRALQDAHRAADLAPVVVLDGGAEEAGARGAAHRPRALPPRVAAPLRDRARSKTRPTGTSRARSGGDTSCPSGTAPTATSPSTRPSRTRAPSAARRELDTLDRRARHVVLLGAVAVRHARLAGRHARTCAPSTRATSTRRRATSSASGRTA